jgi:phosphate starvation-inducible membrane PsiE
MTYEKCISYRNKLYEFILPSPIILKTFCMSYDKTEIFITSLIRLVIYIILLKSTKKYNSIQIILYIFILLNLIYMIVIILKTPILSVNQDKSVLGLD